MLRPNLKVLFTSGYPAEVIAERGVLDYGAAYIAKPFTPDGLLRKVLDSLATPARIASQSATNRSLF